METGAEVFHGARVFFRAACYVSRVDGDLVLLERWRGGDQSAGRALFERHFASIYRFFENKCRGAVDDLAQRTFLQCVKSRDRFEGKSSFRTYLFSIARHELHQHLRSSKREVPIDFDVESIARLTTTPGTRLARAERFKKLSLALASLPVEAQLMLELCYWHELDSNELAQVFEIPAATVRVKLHRARKALRAILDEQNDAPENDPLASSLRDVEDEPAP